MTRGGRAVVLIAAVLAAGCTGPAGPTPSFGEVGGPPARSTVALPPATFDAPRHTGCGAPARELVLLCEAVELAVEHHLDPVDPAELAAAALLGLPRGGGPPPGPPVPMPPCPVPGAGFDDVCTRIAELAARGVAPSASATAAVTAMYRFGLDPYSTYVPPADGHFEWDVDPGGIPWLGLSVAIMDERGAPCAAAGGSCRLLVTSVLPGSGGERAGVLPGDEILTVGGIPVAGRSFVDLVPELAVPGGAEVVMEVARPDSVLRKHVVADVVSLSAGGAETVAEGVVRLWLADFSEAAAGYAGSVLASDDVRRARGLILDLRGNPGGLVLAAQAVASQFLDGGTVFVERTRDGTRPWPVLEGGLVPDDLPVVVLVDGGTASAAEIVAGALQEAGRAVVVGTRTFGKHVVQEAFDGRDGGTFRITIGTWTTAAGTDVAFTGLTPDVVVSEPPVRGRDPALERAVLLLGG